MGWHASALSAACPSPSTEALESTSAKSSWIGGVLFSASADTRKACQCDETRSLVEQGCELACWTIGGDMCLEAASDAERAICTFLVREFKKVAARSASLQLSPHRARQA